MFVCQVDNTHELSASLRKSLMRVTTWKFIPRSKCYSAEVIRLLV